MPVAISNSFSLGRLCRTLRLGLRSLWLHRLRSLLTVLGIVFGVCSVIAMLAIEEGASYKAQEAIKNLGSQNIIIRSVKPPDEQKVSDAGSQGYFLYYGLTYTDVRRIRATIPGVTLDLPGRILRDDVAHLHRKLDCDVVGTVPWYPEMRNHPVASGRFFTDREMATRAGVCVLEAELAPRLFPLESPLGKYVRVGADTYYQAIGVMEPRGQEPQPAQAGSATPAARLRLFIPLETAKVRYGEITWRRRPGGTQAERVLLHEVTVKVAALEAVPRVAAAINEVLQRNHKKKDYELVVPLEMLKQAEALKHVYSIVLGSIAAISLLVGGIGIMNIMLASVTERTREIGIRRALGARRQDIILQFLVETVLLAGAGGLLGVLLGVAVPCVVTQVVAMPTIIAIWSPFLAFGISALVGVVFGLYPAFRAARMDPVEALRHE